MSHIATPIADELEALAASLGDCARRNVPLGRAGMRGLAERLHALSRGAAPLERFHAAVTAEAAEQERLPPDTHAVFLEGFHRVWNTRPC
jgi:hypothetical protein